MQFLDFAEIDKTRPIHLVGIAGSAMNGLAIILNKLGFKVRGTDPRSELIKDRLEPLGICVFNEQDGSRIAADTALVVITQAVPVTHIEVISAQNKNIPVVTYPQCIGALMAKRTGIAVSGTHGKTTVTSMIVSILDNLGYSPGFVIGGFVPALGSGAAAGAGDIFVAEACEYNRSFLELHPKIAVITNIEEDHLDVYSGLDDIQSAFRSFANRVSKVSGTIVYSKDCPNIPAVIRNLEIDLKSFSISSNNSADYQAFNIEECPNESRFDLKTQEEDTITKISLCVPGKHNISNAVAAMAVCKLLGVSIKDSAGCLANFTGAKRRFEYKGEAAGITLIDDYAHHPTAVRLLLSAAKNKYPKRRIIIAFQPHQYSRTRMMLKNFAESLLGADLVIVPNIFFARDTEDDIKSLNPQALTDKVRALGTEACYIGELSSTVSYLSEILKEGDVLILAGAGDIDTIAEPLLSLLKRRGRS